MLIHILECNRLIFVSPLFFIINCAMFRCICVVFHMLKYVEMDGNCLD